MWGFQLGPLADRLPALQYRSLAFFILCFPSFPLPDFSVCSASLLFSFSFALALGLAFLLLPVLSAFTLSHSLGSSLPTFYLCFGIYKTSCFCSLLTSPFPIDFTVSLVRVLPVHWYHLFVSIEYHKKTGFSIWKTVQTHKIVIVQNTDLLHGWTFPA